MNIKYTLEYDGRVHGLFVWIDEGVWLFQTEEANKRGIYNIPFLSLFLFLSLFFFSSQMFC